MESRFFGRYKTYLLNGIGYVCLSHGIECTECRPAIRFLPCGADLDSDNVVNSAQIEGTSKKRRGRNL